ncbi:MULTISPECIES: hypothetical protein [Pseudomonas]|uniref:hypothetical protein n=1 Tax=Pseudomonadaceae TaxID=135621 RepID=UPI0004052B64|nr:MULTISPECIES: hypothetical protein [Pseudomonas]
MNATIPEAIQAGWRSTLSYYLRECRTSRFDSASSNAFYIVLGMVSSARSLNAITEQERDRLCELNLNASNFRSHELREKKFPYTHRPTPTIAQEQSA